MNSRLLFIPVVFTFPVVVFLTLSLPLTQRFFLPPEEVVQELVTRSYQKARPAPPVQYDVQYDRDLLRRYHVDVYGPLPPEQSGTDGGNKGVHSVGATFQSAAPVIVFYHGGSWLRGDKVTIRIIDRFLRRMRQEGWFVVSVNYTASVLRGIGGPVEQAMEAYRWVITNGETYGWDTDRIGLYGVSAGGHVALTTATRAADTDVPGPAFVFAECAPTDLIAMRDGDANDNSGSFRFFPEYRLRQLSPLYGASDRVPPVLLFHGDADTTVDIHQSMAYTKALNSRGGSAELVVWPGGNHAFLNYTDEQWYRQESVALEWMRERLQY